MTLRDYMLDAPDEGLRVCELHGSYDTEPDEGCPDCSRESLRKALKALRDAGVAV